eukprot:TRINITY_DN1877_c1_g1_i1.p1 TRINITY_DN1877_c1_g1~~TRINITY_DN1877_c1_g1_i1.p1  ORF type:complete len:1456 (+),score=169.66 TRINITY_DN1877_c1_g1_i1:180-4547(+)
MQHSKKEAKHKPLIWNWFKGLTPEERAHALLWEDKHFTELLKQMYRKKWREGDGFFFTVDDPTLRKHSEVRRGSNASFVLLPPAENFCFRKLSFMDNYFCFPDAVVAVDKLIEDNVRLCDTREYCDTFTLASTILVDGEKFLSMMEKVTRGGFLNTPCRVIWCEKTRAWVWEQPGWFVAMGFYSLGTYVAHKLEQALWRRYWQVHNIDPRVAGSNSGRGHREQVYQYPNMQGLHTKTHLNNFWNALAPEERRRMIGAIGDIVEDVLIGSRKEDLKTLDWQKPLSTLLDLLLTLLDHQNTLGGFLPSSSPTRMDENEDFIEFVYFSPMHRAFEPLDLIVRRMGKCIQSAYTEKIAMDLILGEEKDKRKKGNNKRGKSKPRNKKDTRKKSGGREKKRSNSLKKPEAPLKPSAELKPDSDSSLGKKKKSRSYIKGNTPPLVEGARLSKSQPGSPRPLPLKRRSNSSPLTPDESGINAANSTTSLSKHITTSKKQMITVQRPHKNGTMLIEGFRVGQSKDDSNIKVTAPAIGSLARTGESAIQTKRRRRGKRRNCGLSTSAGKTALSQSGGHNVESAPVLSDGWSGSVSDSAVGEYEPEEECQPKSHSNAYQVLEIPKRKSIHISPPVPVPFPLYEDYEDFGEDADIESLGSVGDDDDADDDGEDTGDEEHFWNTDTRGPTVVIEAEVVYPDEPIRSLASSTDTDESDTVYQTDFTSDFSGSDDRIYLSGNNYDDDDEQDADSQEDCNTSAEDAIDHHTELVGTQLLPLRGRSRIRSSSIGQIEIPNPMFPTGAMPRKSRARSQPPSNEAIHQQEKASGPTLQHPRNDHSEPSTQTNRTSVSTKLVPPVIVSTTPPPAVTITPVAKRFSTRSSRDTGTSADDLSCMEPTYSRRNAQMASAQNVRTRPSRYVYRRSLSEIVQEERDRAERTKGRGVPWIHPAGPPRVVSAPFPPYNRSTPQRADEPSAGVGIICAGRGAPAVATPVHHQQHPTSPLHLLRPQTLESPPIAYSNQLQPSFSRVSHLLTQSLSDVERVLFLHREIEDIVQYIVRLTSSQRVLQENMLLKLRTIIKQLWGPGSRVECYGSFATDLGIPSSDLDLVVILPHPSPDPSSDLLKRDWSPIRILAEELKKYDWLQSIQAIETAKMPVLKLVGKIQSSHVLVDITFSVQPLITQPAPVAIMPPSQQPWEQMNFAMKGQQQVGSGLDDHSGIAAAKLVRSYTRSLPVLTPLTLVLKQFLYERGLNNTYTGGISSYCLVLMIVAFLHLNMPHSRRPKTTEKVGPQSSQLSEDENLGGALLGFLRFFGLQFDFDKMGISLNSPRGASYFYLREPCNTLVIMDPLAPDRNIGHGVFGMWRVKAAFRYAFSALISPYTTNYAPTLISRILHGPILSLHCSSVEEETHQSNVQGGAEPLHLPAWVPTHAAYLHPELGMSSSPSGGGVGKAAGNTTSFIDPHLPH